MNTSDMEPDDLYSERLRKIEEEERLIREEEEAERQRMIAYPSEEAIESAILRMRERDFTGYILRAYLTKFSQWDHDDCSELERIRDAITPGKRTTHVFSEREAKLLAWAVQEFNAELEHRICTDLDDMARHFTRELRNHRKGDLTGEPYGGPDCETFSSDAIALVRRAEKG